MDADDLTRAWDRAAVAELAYVDGHGRPRATAVTPLVLDGGPAVALPYARSNLARALAASGTVVLSVSDSRMATKGWAPCAAGGTAEVVEDLEGRCFLGGPLAQELRKHPPSRELLDTPVLRREHWWYVPRWIVRVAPQRAWPVGRRSSPAEGVLVTVSGPRQLAVDTVRVEDWDADRVVVTSLAAHDLRGLRGSAVLFTHDFAVPDLDRWVEASATGELRAGVLHVTQRDGRTALPKPLTLVGRLRRLRDLERACRRGLRERV
ncbi:MAG TPA: hypothetical protein VM324_09210 [Egibacteraceae bacterium]|nr:hypothetical protein [Egibacteraceae bacterium]